MEKKHAKTPKEKRRNMERRKEKSRDAARNRRGRETEIFTDLMALLPLSSTKVANLDKASVIRIAISYLKIRAVIQSLPTKENELAEIDGFNMDSLFVDSLEGFLLVTSTEGDIVFISENVNRYLGLQQMEVLGQSIYELSHPCDHAEIKEMLSTKDVNVQKSYFLRMKWNPKGRSVNVSKNAQYKVIQYTGRVIQSQPKVGEDEVNNNSSTGTACGDANKIVSNVPAYHFVAIGEAIWHPANIEVPLGRNTFLSKHSLDMKYTYADERIVDFFGYNPEALIKKSIYDYHHAQDTVVIKNCFKNLFEKGQSQTERYRFLALGGGYAWVVTQSTLIYSNNQKPLSVVCVNFIVSEIENKNEIYALCQLDNTCTSLTEADCSPSVSDNADDGYLYENSPQHLIEKLRINPNPSPLVAATAKAAAAAAATTTSAKNRYSPLTPTASHQRSPSNAVVKKKPAKNQKQKSNILPVLPGLDIEEFLLNSTPPPSASPQSCGSRSPESRLNDQWLMSDGPEEAAFYALTVPSTDTAPATVEIDETDDVEEQIKIETIRGSDDSVKPSDIPKPATVNVFVPFTEEMNKGFLGFTEDDTGLTMLKEDPEDLTHLAPTAGDVCVPLDENPIDYVLPDMLDEIMLSDCNLLSSDTDRDLSSSSPNSFFSYRDDLEPSSRPLSPILTQNEDCSIPSFCSDDSSLHGNPVNHFLDFGLISTSDEMDDLSGKPSYIPLSLDQDPLLPFVTNDFMWGSSSGESSTWSSVPSSPTSNCSLSPRLDHTSSLAKLLKAEPICNYDGGGSDRSDVHGGGGATKNSFGNNVNSLADRNYSNVGNFKTVAYHRNINGINESNRRRTNAVKKETNNNRSEDKRKASQVTIGSKRSMSENWGRGANSCKRSKQTSRTIIINGGGGGNNRRVQESAAMAEAVATAKQTNSVLMNLLVSGCDLNAGYDEDLKDTSRRVCSSVNNNKNSANRLNYEMKNDSVDVPDSKCWSPFKRKSVSLLESESSQIPSLMDLTEQDYAVNAPSAGEILQGSDLLKALECATII